MDSDIYYKLLMEDGGRLLQEDNSFILLENYLADRYMTDNMMNGASRYATLIKGLARTVSDSIMNASSRFATISKMQGYFRTMSDSIMNGASRLTTISRLGTFARTMSDSIMNGASRFATVVRVKGFIRNLSDSIMNSASRFATIAYIFYLKLHPIITFRSNTAPFDLLPSISYNQLSPSFSVLPVLSGEESEYTQFRIYNNYELIPARATAFNIQITTYDGSGASSHTSLKSAISQKWIRIQQMGFGESSTTSAPYTYWKSDELPVGGSSDTFIPEKGSDGGTSAVIRAGTDQNGCGFIEVRTRAELPNAVVAGQTVFSICLIYDWTS
jgi:hypothetical protein